MSVPDNIKKTNHQVIKLNDHQIHIKYFVILNLILTILLFLSAFYILSLLNTHQSTINQLTQLLNQFNYKKSNNPQLSNIQLQQINSIHSKHYNSLQQHIQANFQIFTHQIKKTKTHLSQINEKIYKILNQNKKIHEILQQQSKSSWQMKEIITSIKKKLQNFTKMFEGFEIPNPNFSSMGDKIKGTFSDIKTKIGGMFHEDVDRQLKNQSLQFSKNLSQSIKQKIKRKWQQATKQL